jgi:hypothetical protein
MPRTQASIPHALWRHVLAKMQYAAQARLSARLFDCCEYVPASVLCHVQASSVCLQRACVCVCVCVSPVCVCACVFTVLCLCMSSLHCVWFRCRA